MIINLNNLVKVLAENPERTVVLASGTFDLFHYDHLRYLTEAKMHGDTLVVAVKSNKCARLKGRNRPIIDEEERMAIVDNIKCVDYTILVDYDENVEIQTEYDNEPQRQWLIMFEEVFKQLRPNILYHEDNPALKNARERLFEKYGVKGEPKPRGDRESTSEIIKKIAEGR